MTVMAAPPALAVSPSRARNRSIHYWGLIDRLMGRRKLRAAKDYIAAMLADQPDDVLVAAIEAVERVVGAPPREEV